MHVACFFSRSWKSSLDVTLAEDRFIWLIYWPCGSGGASPKHGGLIDPTVSQTSGLFVVNYRIKAFSGSSSRTVHVLALVKTGLFSCQQRDDNCSTSFGFPDSHAFLRWIHTPRMLLTATRQKEKEKACSCGWIGQPNTQATANCQGTRQVSVRFRFCLKKEPLIPCGLLLSWYTLLRF